MAIENGSEFVLAYLLVSIGVLVAFVGAVSWSMVHRSAARAPPRGTARRTVTYQGALACGADHPAGPGWWIDSFANCYSPMPNASQSCDKHSRPILQALRLQTFFKLKTYMPQSNRMRLKVRIAKAQNESFNSKRLSHHIIQLPHSNYGTWREMHWR
jgi:hypothetical protein